MPPPAIGSYAGRMRTLTTARLELRPWDARFEDDFLRLASDERVTRFIGDGRPWSRERVAERHREHLEHWARHGYGWRAIHHDGDFAGVAALNRLGSLVPGIEESALEIGWWIDPRWWGRGFATEAALALRDEAFADLGAERIAARYQPANTGSERVMIKIGMRRHSDTVGRVGEPVRVYELSRPDWLALPDQEV
ncbi:N-acetyltransferase [Actinoallomurus iriomotensis]|uniref:N-acetyltransferase n=2 Tax=Actinoallomurus iriomotensis TaxID=478107 RepID=A0A9W6RM58_9ACTN|nr:N-acetyltransferase [Actinoallomurus iriomotensis]